MQGVKWLFFDLGSTLLDESQVYEDIFRKIAISANVSEAIVNQKAVAFYKQNKSDMYPQYWTKKTSIGGI